jgi:hypothetical protein
MIAMSHFGTAHVAARIYDYAMGVSQCDPCMIFVPSVTGCETHRDMTGTPSTRAVSGSPRPALSMLRSTASPK